MPLRIFNVFLNRGFPISVFPDNFGPTWYEFVYAGLNATRPRWRFTPSGPETRPVLSALVDASLKGAFPGSRVASGGGLVLVWESAEGHLTGSSLQFCGGRGASGASRVREALAAEKSVNHEVKDVGGSEESLPAKPVPGLRLEVMGSPGPFPWPLRATWMPLQERFKGGPSSVYSQLAENRKWRSRLIIWANRNGEARNGSSCESLSG